MKKTINNPDQLVDGTIEGILLARPDQICTLGDDRRIFVRADSPVPDRVGIVTGGDSGHLPLFKGYISKGLCSGVAIGDALSSPSVQQCADTAKAVDGGAGVSFLYGNYGGGVFNFDLAVGLLELDDIETCTVPGYDNVASQPKERVRNRRDVAGVFFAYKAAGTAAKRGGNLGEVAAVMQEVVDNTAIMDVDLSPTILPITGATSFDLSEGKMEIGIGIRDESGIRYGPLGTVDEIVDQILNSVIPDLGLAEGDRVVVPANSLGATPLEEFYLLYRRIHQGLASLGVVIECRYIGRYVTSLEMAGASISLLKIDDGLLELLDVPTQSSFFREV